MFTNRLKAKSFNIKEPTKTEIKEKNWDQRFVLSKIPPYDAFKDSNYLSLGLMKSKIEKLKTQIKDYEKKNEEFKQKIVNMFELKDEKEIKQIIVKENDPVHYVYFIKNGSVKLTSNRSIAENHILIELIKNILLKSDNEEEQKKR